MNRQRIRKKLEGMLIDLDELISSADGRTRGLTELIRCRVEITKLLEGLRHEETVIAPSTIVVIMYRLINSIYSWVSKDK